MTIGAEQVEPVSQTLELAGKHLLVVERASGQSTITLLGAGGQMCLSIAVTSAGPVLRLEGAGLMLQTTGALAIDAGHVAIHGREGVSISSGADARICVLGDLETQARAQLITAVLGDVKVEANDDVKLDGERILMNC